MRKMKKIFALIIFVFFAALAQANVLAQEIPWERLKNAVIVSLDANSAFVDGKLVRVDENRRVAPYIDSADRTNVPLRFISEAFAGVSVEWNDATRTAIITDGGTKISLREGGNAMTVERGGSREEIVLESRVERHYNRLFVPLRAIAEALRKEIFFDRGLIIISETKNLFDAQKDNEILDAICDLLGVLPTVGNAENFGRILSEINSAQTPSWYHQNMWEDVDEETTSDTFDMPTARPTPQASPMPRATESSVAGAPSMGNFDVSAAPSEMPALGAGSADFSETNVQVAGVDEADVVKTDGELIYYLRSNELVISRAYPAKNMEVLRKMQIRDFSPKEMYVDGNKLILLGQQSAFMSRTRIYIYEIDAVLKNGSNATPRVITLDGDYLSSRKIGENIYVTANSIIRRGGRDIPVPLPFYSDAIGLENEDIKHLSYNQIRCFPEPRGDSYLIVAAFNINRPEQRVNISAYIGAGDNIYMSHENMFVAQYNRGYHRGFHGTDGGGRYTKIYKFGLGDGRLTFSGQGQVDGTILNQWSMDEHRNYFRIATTRDWRNNVFVLNEDLKVVGEIRDIAPTERIYSTRFMGDTLYMVTFRMIDPFFVIDLSNPYSPKLLGELKIPGYSDYLHPFGENLILGIGKDSVEYRGNAWEQGLRMTLFDVSDFYNPVDLFYITIGGRGTDSEALKNPRAFLICTERNIIAFPATVHGENANPTSSGAREFQGGLIFGADLKNGEFVLKGTITHQEERTDALGRTILSQSINQNRAIRRMLYIGEFIYGLSNFGISAHDFNILEVNRIEY
jgi:uncharacterized secreted protein with C-terminal beta-propeller domain